MDALLISSGDRNFLNALTLECRVPPSSGYGLPHMEIVFDFRRRVQTF
jgi:hypothetical protein